MSGSSAEQMITIDIPIKVSFQRRNGPRLVPLR
jgi:hypothetical protein